ncbi:MAG: hypothetical protein XD89_0930 [Anaerolineae bacterium 49_20]|nr:MAG: hypothetical protein XD89_0930 [Anaerolineae bacterium 49_20]
MKKLLIIYIAIFSLALIPLSNVVNAGTIPTFSIQGVTEGEKVTIVTQNYPADKDFVARMGLLGTQGIDGTVVGTVNSGDGGSLVFTFDIPAELQAEDAIAIRLDSTTGGYYSYNWFYNNDFGSHEGGTPADDAEETPEEPSEPDETPEEPSTYTGIPTFTITDVVEDENVTIVTDNFPAEYNFDVLMGKIGTQGINGIYVTTVNSGAGGALTGTFDIPDELKGESKIAIRLQSDTDNYYAYNWFYNNDGNEPDPVYTGIPAISISSVEPDESVTVELHNFPYEKEFIVLMGKIGTRGIGGIEVTRIDSGDGGDFTETFEIPAELEGLNQIAIRLQTSDGVFYAYNWFYNNTESASTPEAYTGIPTFTISEVVKDESVSVLTNNFPANYDFDVLMGKMFTKGINGIYVTTVNSGEGGALSGTFSIPEALQGDDRIAIRLQSTIGGFYAYNWFFNADYP